MWCKGKGQAKLCADKPQKYALRILVESYHIILFASLCVVQHIKVVLLVLLYVVISVVLLLFIVYKACTMNPAMLHPTKRGHFRRHMIAEEVRRIQTRN